MKKLLVILFIVVILLVTTASALAAENVKILIDGKELVFAAGEQKPIVENGRVLVPLRKLFENLDCTVDYNPGMQQIKIFPDRDKNKGTLMVCICMTINDKTAYVFDLPTNLDVPPQIVNGSTLVPLRFVTENSRCQVDWDAKTRTVSVNTPGLIPIADYFQENLLNTFDNGSLVLEKGEYSLEAFFFRLKDGIPPVYFNIRYQVKDPNSVQSMLDRKVSTAAMAELRQVLIDATEYYQIPVDMRIWFYSDWSDIIALDDSTAELALFEEVRAKVPEPEYNSPPLYTVSDEIISLYFLEIKYDPETKTSSTKWYYQSEPTVEIIK